MSALLILFGGFACLFLGYVTYGSWLSKQWGVDNSKPTPAHTMQDGVDYVPAKAPVLLGHHFSSIAGAGPINGPIQAAFFGWLPCLLWMKLFSSGCASLSRNEPLFRMGTCSGC